MRFLQMFAASKCHLSSAHMHSLNMQPRSQEHHERAFHPGEDCGCKKVVT
jgi:hypothetical protein